MQIPGYTIQQTIAEGGMATAYLALQESLRRQVVLKVLHTTERHRPEDTERFLNEGRIVASLNHPNVITIYDIGVRDDLIYMSMEYVDGGDLRARLRNSISPAEALHIVTAVGHGLNAAHKKGIVHRDVKPGNILFRRDGTPLLTDFGIAKQLTVDHDLTHTGIFLGSPNYMAPEQAEPGAIDGRADIYSLGIILYEMLTGLKPYQSDSVIEIILKHRQAPLPKLPAELKEYQPLLNLMLAKKCKERFRDVDSLLHYIRQLKRHQPTTDEPRSPSAPSLSRSTLKSINDVGDKAQAVRMPLTRPSRRRHMVLVMLLATAWLGNEGLLHLKAKLEVPKDGVRTALIPPSPQELPPPDFVPAAPTTPHAILDAATQEVAKALAWLGQRSLDEYRLTSPPKDNAYHYFSRLLELEPGNPQARRGLRNIAERFAFLAEKELAEDRYDQAQHYVAIGLRIDPGNEALVRLQILARHERQNLIEKILFLFKHI